MSTQDNGYYSFIGFCSGLLKSQSLRWQRESSFSLNFKVNELLVCNCRPKMSYNLFIDSDDDVTSASHALLSDTVEYRQPCSQVRVLQRRLQSAWGGNRRSNSFSMSKQNNPQPRFSIESNSLPSSPDRLKSIASQFSFAKIRNSALNKSESEERLNGYFFEPKQPAKVTASVNRWVFFSPQFILSTRMR